MIRSFVGGEFNINVLLEKNEPLFFAKEVARILGYTDTDCAIRRHVDPEFKIEFGELQDPGESPGSFGRHPRQILIKEPGFYALVFRSELPQAREFRNWVFSEVLPQIRKTGSYSLDDGLLKLRDISMEDILKMDDSRRKEFKKEMKKTGELLKDPETQRKCSKGGIALWKRIREKEEECEELKKKLAAIESILGK